MGLILFKSYLSGKGSFPIYFDEGREENNKNMEFDIDGLSN